VQFFYRIYTEVEGCKVGAFTTLKYIIAESQKGFRHAIWKARYLGGFITPSGTHYNCSESFPIAFLIWDLSIKEDIWGVKMDVWDMNRIPDTNGNRRTWKEGEKTVLACDRDRISVFFCKHIKEIKGERIGCVVYWASPDINHSSFCKIGYHESRAMEKANSDISENNLINSSVYFSIRHCVEHTWLNDRDQFYYPFPSWENDIEFHNNCLMFALFHGQNYIQSKDGVNHWIPFTEEAVGASKAFGSRFMSDFLKGRELSPEAKEVYNAGLEIWRYYFSKGPENQDASFYDIKEYFRGRTDAGRLRPTSGDDEFNRRMDILKAAMKALAAKIAEKAYAHGFLIGEHAPQDAALF
jgi:hypothetical protein